jgi:hypothetical protein
MTSGLGAPSHPVPSQRHSLPCKEEELCLDDVRALWKVRHVSLCRVEGRVVAEAPQSIVADWPRGMAAPSQATTEILDESIE